MLVMKLIEPLIPGHYFLPNILHRYFEENVEAVDYCYFIEYSENACKPTRKHISEKSYLVKLH